MSDRAKLQLLHAAATKAKSALAPLVGDIAEAAAALAELEAALDASDPKKARATTPLGARILEAAIEVGLDEARLSSALALPPGALTRLLYTEPKKLKLDQVEHIALVIGCEVAWLRTGEGERRTKPVPPGVVSARSLGASEEAIRVVLERDGVVERDEGLWLAAFLEETKRLRESPPREEASTTRLRE
jgi:hypothetical protein